MNVVLYRTLVAMAMVGMTVPFSLQAQDEASLKSLLLGRFRNGKPIRLAMEVEYVNEVRDNAKKYSVKVVNCYEIDPLDPVTWRYDNLSPSKTGRGGSQLTTIISKNGVRACCFATLDNEEVERFNKSSFEFKDAKGIASATVDLTESFGTLSPDNLDRYLGLSFAAVPFEQFFSTAASYKIALEDGDDGVGLNALKLQGVSAENFIGRFDLKSGVLRYCSISKEADGSGLIEVIKASGGERISDSFWFGVADQISVENYDESGFVASRVNINVNQAQTRVLSHEEFEERLNPELPLGAYVSKDKAGQDTTIIEEDLPLRLWDYERLFTPERKAKGLIEYLKKAQE